MASKFHVTDDGPKPCSAQPGNCPLGGEHYETEAEAQVAYDGAMEEKRLATLKKEPREGSESSDEGHEASKPPVYSIAEDNLEKAKGLIKRLNGRLERAGIEERFEVEYEEDFYIEEENVGGLVVKKVIPYYKAHVNTPSISYDGYTFQAMMDRTDGDGFVTRAAEGVDLQGWRPDEMKCDHCGHNRKRGKTFLIQGPDGERKQIGSTCVQSYLGMSPEGLRYMFDSPLESVRESRGGGGGISYPETEQSLAIALAVSNNGMDYRPTRLDDSTVQRVREALYGGDRVDKEWRTATLEEAEALQDSGAVDELRRKIDALPDDSDYTRNMKALVNTSAARSQHFAMLVSAVSVVQREERERRIAQEKEERERAKKEKRDSFTEGYYAPVDTKITKGTKMTVVSTRQFETSDYYGNSITKTAVTMRSEDGHMVSWFSNNNFGEGEMEPGSEIEISSGVVKKHGSYDGIDQTMLSRVRLMKKKQ